MAIPPAGYPSRPESKSQYVAESGVQPFLQPDFDPADYLNKTLPSLSSSSISRTTQTRAVSLSDLSTQLQTLLSQLNAHTSRLSNTLTQLTDEIIRSGGRLAYEVEVLRGETGGVTDALENGLKKDIELFTSEASEEGKGMPTAAEPDEAGQDVTRPATEQPEYLERLRTLTLVRSRLDSVVKVFGDAMAWPIPPSETASLISISAPENDAQSRDREEKGKQYAEDLRLELNELIGGGNDMVGLEAAAVKLEQLHDLTEVWMGTAEERARQKLVESLQKPIESRQKALGRTSVVRQPGVSPSPGIDYRYGGTDSSKATNEGGYGFLQNLKNLKNEMYIE